ncbi:hypothetical protein [Tardibacter chloracetimidivorans]|uniref:hypothetical protein n=1 Tax=Tardibacter chloracetimidivorans TaxID=1921510 RepID=UPI0013015B6C|nr:hypothetical protein [Tardibacter chloracetimidivorans]
MTDERALKLARKKRCVICSGAGHLRGYRGRGVIRCIYCDGSGHLPVDGGENV